MKKYLAFVFLLILCGCSLNKDTKKDNLKIYLFYSATCPHCHNELNWLSEIKSKYKNVTVISYEVSRNRDLYEKVSDKMDIEDMYVPLTIIGSHYIVGFNDDKQEEIESYIEKYSEISTCDVVDNIINDKNFEECRDKNYKNLEN